MMATGGRLGRSLVICLIAPRALGAHFQLEATPQFRCERSRIGVEFVIQAERTVTVTAFSCSLQGEALSLVAQGLTPPKGGRNESSGSKRMA